MPSNSFLAPTLTNLLILFCNYSSQKPDQIHSKENLAPVPLKKSWGLGLWDIYQGNKGILGNKFANSFDDGEVSGWR